MMVVNKTLIIALALLFQSGLAPKTILFFGDSITAGYGLSPEDAFPAHVEAMLVKKGMDVKVVNAGLSGETSAGGLSRIDWVLRQPIDVFILELGANDGLRGLPLGQTRANLQAIIDKVKAKNPKVKLVLAGMMVPPNLGEEYTTEFKEIYPRLARKNNASLIPFLLEGVAGDGQLNLADGIHPNVAGHKIVARTVLKTIEPLLK
ncbi:MAG: arylesterase [Cyclobacteriaceae bacterium]|nr:arylesterase [Cyclobacteriaceae bacterium]MCB0500412.1 arylesterase [Cyclobacteriaceae bacterium]MCB9236773.1 arylesterase [Flammeovirgaceae bacterium]MCO5272342.1 arylesterase [Cyclobacteriaceae bacterium]MCW5902052.1 arylesterase [Cyclobacteriaceae bacterium]